MNDPPALRSVLPYDYADRAKAGIEGVRLSPHIFCHTMARIKRRFVVTLPKAARGRRKVALTQLTIDALYRHQESQALERRAAGTAWQDNNLVFPNEVGERMDGPYVYRYQFLRLLERANLPRIRFHDLRHSAATLLLLQGVHPKVVSEMLGHSNISITLDLYSHVLPEMQRDATNALDKLLRDNTGQQE